jgi:DNA-binding transcriptional regulator YhcF (GntR family)
MAQSAYLQEADSAGMPSAFDRTLAVRRPLHLRLREEILRDLVQAGLAPGQRYSTEQKLAERFRVSRNTLRKAMAGLEKDGYLSRRRRVGAIAGRRPLPADRPSETPIAARQRAMVILPRWDDSVEGRYAGQLLRALSAPELSPPLAVEIRHHNDPVAFQEAADAVIVAMDPRGRAIHGLRDIASRGAKVIVIGPAEMWPEFMLIACDHRNDTRRAVRRLYEMGHHSVGLMNHDPSHLSFSQILMGYLDAHNELGKSIPPGALVQCADGAPPSGEADVKNVSAWVCAFIGGVGRLARKCHEAGLSIPRDVSIITIDDPGEILVPELGRPVTGIRDNFAEAAQRVHALINDWPETRRGQMTYISTQWIDRGTVMPPKTSAES